MCPAAAPPARLAPLTEPVAHGREHRLRVAREAADGLAAGTVVREQAGKAPGRPSPVRPARLIPRRVFPRNVP
ncbi:hypothetical protein [Streptomyces sp. BSE7-9]|uniref:hypothetical protein n=1 Tax=Streptomyces sp. BSE7-9 TaxID=2759948 RepID=UPI001E2E7FD6|nr:hypothetical protein [Streptomyces sp. BSE7-9]